MFIIKVSSKLTRKHSPRCGSPNLSRQGVPGSRQCDDKQLHTMSTKTCASTSSLIVGRTRVSTVDDRAFPAAAARLEQFAKAKPCHFRTFVVCLPAAPQMSPFLCFLPQ